MVSATSLPPEPACARCAKPSCVVIRTDRLCRECFARYIPVKVWKRLDDFRIRRSSGPVERQLAVALSLGPCSVTLLSLLDAQLRRRQQKSGQTGLKLIVLFVNEKAIYGNVPEKKLLQCLKERFATHEYYSIPLETVLQESDAALDQSHSGPRSFNDDPVLADRLREIIASLSTHSARFEVVQALRRRLLIETAARFGCEGLVWGNTSTKLAESILAETAQGRAYSLPWQLGEATLENMPRMIHPLRDLLRHEVLQYIDVVEPDLRDSIDTSTGIIAPATPKKDLTIDNLMRQYFGSVEQQYPSIVANVVRTTSRLEGKSVTSPSTCGICRLPYCESEPSALEKEATEAANGVHVCHGCARSTQDSNRAAEALLMGLNGSRTPL